MSPDKDTCGLAWTGRTAQKPEKIYQLKHPFMSTNNYTSTSLKIQEMPLQKWMSMCACVCLSPANLTIPEVKLLFIMLFWLNMDCGCLFCLFQAGFVMFCGLGSPLDWPGSSLILCVLFQFASSQNPQSTGFCHEIRVAIPEMQSTKPEMHMKWYEMLYVISLGESVHNKQPYVKLGAGWHCINGQTQKKEDTPAQKCWESRESLCFLDDLWVGRSAGKWNIAHLCVS